MDKLDKVRGIGVGGSSCHRDRRPRPAMVREGLRFTAQPSSRWASTRTAIMTATLRDMEASLIDAALTFIRGIDRPRHNKREARVKLSSR